MNELYKKSAVASPPAAYDACTKLPVVDRGPWVATSRGEMWSIQNPHPDDVFIDDLAWGMSRQCRYGGQIKPEFEMYAVSEHSVKMTWWAVEERWVTCLEDALAVLLHDCSEAFFGDIPTPIKALMPEYKVLEDHAQSVITHAFGLTPENTLITKGHVKDIDKRIRVDERMHIISEPACSKGLHEAWVEEPDLKALGVEIECMLPSQARLAFLNCFIWCCENLPARDPVVSEKVKFQISHLPETFSGSRPHVHEVTENPFEAVVDQTPTDHSLSI